MSLMVFSPGSPSVPGVGTPGTPAAPSRSAAFRVGLTGGDGSSWDLTSGPVRLLSGPQLFAAPDVSHWWRVSPVLDGSRRDGMRTPQREIVLPIMTSGDDWRTWRDTDAAFFRAIHPANECQISVTTPDAYTRTLGGWFVSGGDVDTDPLTQNFAALYSLEFTAASPFWRGQGVSAEFFPQAPLPLFPGPPFNINRSSASESSTVTNPGDEPSYPRYIIEGTASTWAVGVGDALVSSDTPQTADQSVTIDTDPSQLTVLDQDGNSVYNRLASDDFEPIPAGVDVSLSLQVTGFDSSTRVRVEFDDLYRRPW